MKWKKILLLVPNYRTSGYDFYDSAFPPLALEYIAAYVEDMADVKILDTKAADLNFKEVYEEIKAYSPDLIGLTVPVTSGINLVLKYAKIAKKMGITTVIGGWHPTLAVEQTLSSPWIDILVRGEGEFTFRELIKKGSPEDVAGLSYKEGGKLIHNEDRPFIEDLDSLRMPARHLVTDYDYKIFNLNCAAIETSRGCPQGCKFCSTHVVYKRSWRPRSVKNIIKELEQISEIKKIEDVFLVDDNILVNMQRMKKLCLEIIKAKNEGRIRQNLYFFFQGRLDSMARHPDITKLMGKAGFWLVLVGVEATDDARLKQVDKGCKMDQIKRGIEVLHESNIVCMGNVILGTNLDDTVSDCLRTITNTLKLGLDLPSFTLLTPFPGTLFYKELKKKDRILTEDYSKYNWLNPVIETKNLSPEVLKLLLFLGFYYVSYYGGGLKNKLRLASKVIKKRGIKFVFNLGRIRRGYDAYFSWRDIVLNNIKELKEEEELIDKTIRGKHLEELNKLENYLKKKVE